jgi:hypothetical protein
VRQDGRNERIILCSVTDAASDSSPAKLSCTELAPYVVSHCRERSFPPLISTFSSFHQEPVKKHILKAALKKAVADGVLVQNKNSYKLSVEAKKAKPAAPKKVKETVKKTAPKKKVRVKANYALSDTGAVC